MRLFSAKKKHIYFIFTLLSLVLGKYHTYLLQANGGTVTPNTLPWPLSSYGAHGKFGEHERSEELPKVIAEGNSSFLSALQTSQVLHNSIVHS